MESLTDFTLFKSHVRADDFTEDDAYLQHLLCTAEEAVVRATNRELIDLLDMGGGNLPLALQHASMLLAAHWYNQRESVANAMMSEVPYTYTALIRPYTRLA